MITLLALHQIYGLKARRSLMKSMIYSAELFSHEFYTLSFPGVHDMHFTKILEKESKSQP